MFWIISYVFTDRSFNLSKVKHERVTVNRDKHYQEQQFVTLISSSCAFSEKGSVEMCDDLSPVVDLRLLTCSL